MLWIVWQGVGYGFDDMCYGVQVDYVGGVVGGIFWVIQCWVGECVYCVEVKFELFGVIYCGED